jgi:hypothetical protein
MQLKTVIPVIDKNITSLAKNEQPAGYRSAPYGSNSKYFEIIYYQNECYELARRGGAAAINTLKKIGGGLLSLGNADAAREEFIKVNLATLKPLWYKMKTAADKEKRKNDKSMGSLPAAARKCTAEQRKRMQVMKEFRNSMASQLGGDGAYDDDVSSITG